MRNVVTMGRVDRVVTDHKPGTGQLLSSGGVDSELTRHSQQVSRLSRSPGCINIPSYVVLDNRDALSVPHLLAAFLLAFGFLA
jgi:hypothetical protein